MNILVNGILLGLGYCLLTIGMTLILGVAKVFDLVYASYYTLAAYVVAVLISTLAPSTIPIWLFFPIAVAVVVALALIIHIFLVLPIRKNPTAVMVSTIAVAMVIQELFILKEGSEPVHMPSMVKGASEILGIWVTNQKLLVAGATLTILVLLWLFFSRTRLGLAIRAAAEQSEAVQLVGGNLRFVYLSAAVLAAILAAIGGLLLSPIYPAHPYAWLDLLIVVFAVMVLGGLGNIWGCLPAALILGISEVIVAVYVPYGGIIKRAVGLLIILFVLMFRPIGLFGVRGWEEEA